MILPLAARGLYSESPPEPRSSLSNNPTLLYSWWCTIFALVVIGFRLGGRYIRNERLFREDKVMALSLVPLLARMAMVHVVLVKGTNNALTTSLGPADIRNREIGSKFVLAARIFYCMFIWTAKVTVTEFLKRMTERFWKKGYEIGLRAIQAFLLVTFIAVVVVTLTECRPFPHYWQVVPDPGPQCRQGYLNLFVMGISDIITDLLIVGFPIPIILQSQMPVRRKVSLVSLFSMSLVLIAITGARMPLVVQKRGLQQFRTVFASSEILAATVVSNAIILGSFLRDRGVKKQKYKFGSTTNDSMDRRASSTRRHTAQPLGSDENLARSLGFRMPIGGEEETRVPRPAPVADLALLSPRGPPPPFSTPDWQGKQSRQSLVSQDSDLIRTNTVDDAQPSPRTTRRVSFFDVGGLLENGSSIAVGYSPTDSVSTQDFAIHHSKHSSRTSSHLQQGRRSFRLPQRPEGLDLTERPMPEHGVFLSEREEVDAIEMDQFGASKARLTESPTKPRSPAITVYQAMARDAKSDRRTGEALMPSLNDAGGLLSSPLSH